MGLWLTSIAALTVSIVTALTFLYLPPETRTGLGTAGTAPAELEKRIAALQASLDGVRKELDGLKNTPGKGASPDSDKLSRDEIPKQLAALTAKVAAAESASAKATSSNEQLSKQVSGINGRLADVIDVTDRFKSGKLPQTELEVKGWSAVNAGKSYGKLSFFDGGPYLSLKTPDQTNVYLGLNSDNTGAVSQLDGPRKGFKVYSESYSNGGMFSVSSNSGQKYVHIGMDTDDQSPKVRFRNRNNRQVFYVGPAASNSTLLEIQGPSGDRKLQMFVQDNLAQYQVCNSGACTVLRGGGDIAERMRFPASAGLRPGFAVTISPASKSDMVVLSNKPYDPLLAGIVSGAGGLEPALIMGELPEGPDTVPVALAGIVYAYVDAEQGAISKGDLLTTSATPGHLMRADPDRARPGTVAGKALEDHPNGRGLVRILVSPR